MARGPLREVSGPTKPSREAASLIPLTPLAVSGLVVSKADLIKSLRVFAPQLVDITSLDENHYWLILGPGGQSDE